MNTEFTVDYFLRKYSKIKDELWTTGYFINDGMSCALGHCGVDAQGEKLTKEAIAISNLFDAHFGRHKEGKFCNGLSWHVVDINDGNRSKYQQSTPKQRILAALRDIKAKETRKDITRELAVLPVEETSDLLTDKILEV